MKALRLRPPAAGDEELLRPATRVQLDAVVDEYAADRARDFRDRVERYVRGPIVRQSVGCVRLDVDEAGIPRLTLHNPSRLAGDVVCPKCDGEFDRLVAVVGDPAFPLCHGSGSPRACIL